MGKLPFRQVHLDFHTSELIPGIGSKFDKKQFQENLVTGHVNSITVFAKCHHGWAYHDTEKNHKHPHLDFDLLTAMLDACHEIGVQTPVYISAGLDEKIAREHPEWLLRNKDESVGWNGGFMNAGYHLFCFNSPYFEVLIAQVIEITEKFKDIEGYFLDIVSPRICYCQNCVKILRSEGKDPRDDAAVRELGERTYKKYYTEIEKAVHKINPELRIFHNGGHIPAGRRDLAFANTHLEIESLPTGGWGYDHFPMSARYVQGLGLEYLGMTGKFHTTWGEFGGFKHPNALKYEVALSVANGAKCSIGDQMHPEGFLEPATYELIGAAYAEVEAVEEYCDDVLSVADVALFGDDYYAGAFGNCKKSFVGASRMMLEGKYLFDIVDADSDIGKYKLVILPDCIRLDGKLKAKLDKFTKGGGKILATGSSGLGTGETANEFAFDFGASFAGKNAYRPCYFRPEFKTGDLKQTDFVLYGEAYDISRLPPSASLTPPSQAKGANEVLGWRRDPYFNRDTFSFSSHQHTPPKPEDAAPGMTKGENGIYIAWAIFEDYATKGGLICKEIVKYAVDSLLGKDKTFVSNLPSGAVATLMKQPQEGRYINHLLYASPTKRGDGVEVIEDLVPLYGVEVELLLPEEIKKAYDAKTKEPVAFVREGGRTKLAVGEFACHKAIVLEY